MAAYRGISVDVSGLGEPQRLDGASVTAGLFPALGVQPLAGRTFTAEDDREDAPGTVVLSYGLWQNEFGGDPAVIGRTVNLDNTPFRIIGVMPRSFYFPSRNERMWTAMRWGPRDYDIRLNTYVVVIGRLKPEMTLDRAQAEMRTIGSQLARQYPQDLGGTTVNAVRMRDDISPRSVLMLKVLMGAAVCVLLIACANLANLLLARAMVRRRELAVRTALGAGRERLVRQMLTESLLLSLAGGGLGWALAHAAMPVLARLVPVSLPMAEVPVIDPRVMAAATLLVCAIGTGFGLIPRAARPAAADRRRTARRRPRRNRPKAAAAFGPGDLRSGGLGGAAGGVRPADAGALAGAGGGPRVSRGPRSDAANVATDAPVRES